jgi:23S rRNA (cytosine1962-C5)-methyltransferase
MNASPEHARYRLVDFGRGRKLEQFGPWLLDRPCPAATGPPASPRVWSRATARFAGPRTGSGAWSPSPSDWRPAAVELDFEPVAGRRFALALEPLPSGQLGLFPEQQANWAWIARQAVAAGAARGAAPKVLNLFAYTGGSTLAAALAGAEVCHVDAARSVVARARRNAQRAAAGLPVRWLVEDALRFCRREVQRGQRYDAVILDPPSFGRGPRGEAWVIGRDLPRLLDLCGQLTGGCPAFALASCHTPGIEADALAAALRVGLPPRGGTPEVACGDLTLVADDGRLLPSGCFARWPA